MEQCLFAMQNHSNPRCCTYKQTQELDAQVVKGSKGTVIQYWQFSESALLKDKNGKPILDAHV